MTTYWQERQIDLLRYHLRNIRDVPARGVFGDIHTANAEFRLNKLVGRHISAWLSLGTEHIDGFTYPGGNIADPNDAHHVTLRAGDLLRLRERGEAYSTPGELLAVYGTADTAVSIRGIASALRSGGGIGFTLGSSTGV